MYCDIDYLVSDDGYILSKSKHTPLKPSINKGGYETIKISNQGVVKALQVHKAIMMTFNGEDYRDGLQVNHKDGNKRNNKLSNLEWVTPKENTIHARDVLGYDFRRLDEIRPYEKPITAHSADGEMIYSFPSATKAGRYFSDDPKKAKSISNSINRALNRRRKTYQGLIWDYVEM